MKAKQANFIWLAVGLVLTCSAFSAMFDPSLDFKWRSGALGFAVFSANFVLLGLIGYWLFSRLRQPGRGIDKGASIGLVIGFLVKIVFLGGLSYLALAVYQFDGLGYAVGALGSLAVITMSALLLKRFPSSVV